MRKHISCALLAGAAASPAAAREATPFPGLRVERVVGYELRGGFRPRFWRDAD